MALHQLRDAHDHAVAQRRCRIGGHRARHAQVPRALRRLEHPLLQELPDRRLHRADAAHGGYDRQFEQRDPRGRVHRDALRSISARGRMGATADRTSSTWTMTARKFRTLFRNNCGMVHIRSEPIYGDGHAGERIADVLSTVEWELQKRITY